MVQRKSGHVTLLDVARACGFSVSTVSIVLNEAPLSQNVAAATRQQIRTMAQQLGTIPTPLPAPCAAAAARPSAWWPTISLTHTASPSCTEFRRVCSRPAIYLW